MHWARGNVGRPQPWFVTWWTEGGDGFEAPTDDAIQMASDPAMAECVPSSQRQVTCLPILQVPRDEL